MKIINERRGIELNAEAEKIVVTESEGYINDSIKWKIVKTQ